MKNTFPTDEALLFRQFPKIRPPLPAAYVALYEREYLANRTSGGLANQLARRLESWMHLKVRSSARKASEDILELGAGSLNHISWERAVAAYDIVEPFHALFEGSEKLASVRQIYDQISEIPPERQYDRILSVAVLEHMLDLPKEIALACTHLRDDGVFCGGFPTEGGWLWQMAWRYGTGAAFRRRTGLDYAVMMRHEHVNTAEEIENCVRYYFHDVAMVRFPIQLRFLSLYTFVLATGPHRTRCSQFLAGCRNGERGNAS
jgi:SAM-dependent methyltransferase